MSFEIQKLTNWHDRDNQCNAVEEGRRLGGDISAKVLKQKFFLASQGLFAGHSHAGLFVLVFFPGKRCKSDAAPVER